VKDLCRPRLELEAGLEPWGVPAEVDGVSSGEQYLRAFDGVVMKGENIFAYPPTIVKQKTNKDILFHVMFQPRGLMSPSYPFDGDVTIKAWDVAFSPDIYPSFDPHKDLDTERAVDHLTAFDCI
jgi:hypothetical protein